VGKVGGVGGGRGGVEGLNLKALTNLFEACIIITYLRLA